MQRIIRTFVAGLLPISMLVGIASATSAQGDGVGPDVPISDEGGVTHGTVTVRELEDPFPGADPDRPAEQGERYVGLIVAFTAADDQTFDGRPDLVWLHDTDGWLYSPSYIPRPADVIQPDLQSQTLAPGNRISGFIGYAIPEAAVIDEIIYVPDSYRAIPLVDLRGAAGPPNGSDVPIVVSDGSQGLVTVTLEDPFGGVDPGAPPQEGIRYVGLTAAFENTGEVVFSADPSKLHLRAADGTLYWPTYVPRPADSIQPDLQSQSLAPGNRISGFVGYNVPEGATILGVDLWPETYRRVEVVDLVGGGEPPTTETTGPPETTAPAPEATPVPAASLVPAPTAGTGQ
jgi:hypothetical protein